MPLPAHRYKVIFFDLGNTLLYQSRPWDETLPSATRAMMDVLRRHGLQLDEERFCKQFEDRLSSYYQERETEFIEYTTAYLLSQQLQEFGVAEVSEETIREALAALYQVSQAHWIPEEDAVPTLQALRERGLRLGVISNASDADDVEALIDKARIRPYFEHIYISAVVGRRKPHPHIFEVALQAFGVRPEEAAMVGDTLGADILGANNLGITSIWITRRADTPDNRDHLDTIQPDYTIRTLAELPGLLA